MNYKEITVDRTWHYLIDIHASEDFWYSLIEPKDIMVELNE